MGLGLGKVTALGTVNELVEHGVRVYRPDLLWGAPDSFANTVVDMAALLAGWGLGRLLDGPTR
jgi:hypothetical protein